MSNIGLSKGDLATIFSNQDRFNNPVGGVYQCHNTRKADANSGGNNNRKNLIMISDGVYHMKALLRNDAVSKAQNGGLKKGDVLRVTRAEPAVIKERKKYVLLIDNLEILQSENELVNPNTEFLDAYFANHPNESIAVDESSTPAPQSVTPQIPVQQQNQRQSPVPQQSYHSNDGNNNFTSSQKSRPIFAIEQLSPYQNMWTIKARVSFKGDIKTWSNQRGEGKLFNVNFLDTSGEIRATAFNDNAVKFYEILQEGKVYYVSKARIQPAKPQFSNLKHPYELQLDRDTSVEECFDEVDVPKMNFSFVKLSAIENQEPNSNIDVLGVIKTVNPHFEMTSKAGKKFDRRDITIVDDSGYSISIGLWNQQAIDFNLPEGSVVAVKGARVTDFGGKSLSMGFNSTLHANPEIPEAYSIKGWYDAKGHDESFHSLKQEVGSSTTGNAVKFIANRITIAKAQAENLGMSEKGDYFNVKAAVSFLKVDNFAYPACASENCNKKVVEEPDGTWRCEKCDVNHPKPQWRYMLTISVMDESGQLWLTLFNDQAEQLLEIDASSLMEMKESDPEQFSKTTQKVQMNEYDFRVRAREDNYNDVSRIRYTGANVHKLNYKAEADFLADELSKALLN